LTSPGKFLYQSGSEVPVGIGMLEPVGMAVLSTDSRESCVGFMVEGSMARPMSMAAAPWLLLRGWSWEAITVVKMRASAVSFIVAVFGVVV
jgi:hypothetical protein